MSGLAISQEGSEERKYISQLFYLGQPNSYQIHFVVTWNVEAHLTAVKEEYAREGAIRGLHQPVDFESDTITLDIPIQGISISGWTITPLMRPVVTKKQVDNFKEGRLIPCCQLLAVVFPWKNKVPMLNYKVNLKGAKCPHNVLVIILPAGVETYLRTGRVKHDSKGAQEKTVVAVEGGGDIENQLRSRDEYIFQLKQEIATLSETIQELRAENEQLRSQPSLTLIKEGGGTVEDRLRMKDGAIYSLKQKVASLREERDATIYEIKELRAENEQLRSQLSLAPIKEEVEEKPLALVPVKTEVKEEAVTVTKDETTSAQPTAAWDLRGVEVCGEMTVVVHSSSAQQITWEGFGLKLHIDEGSLPAGIHQCTLTIKASIAGQYVFPDNSYLVSAIFWLRCEPMCKFTKPVTVEMQHCARSENVANLKLKFVRAVCSQKQLPYTFKELGGDFTSHSSYGVVEVNGFSGLATTQEGSEDRSYLANLLYKEVKGRPTRCIVDIYIVVTWNLDSHYTVMINHFKGAELETRQSIEFESDQVELKVSNCSDDRWGVKVVNSSVVKKKDVDQFVPGKTSWIPYSHFKAKFSGDLSSLCDLECAVNIVGVKDRNKKFNIDITPEGPVSSPRSVHHVSDPQLNSHHLPSLLQQLSKHAAKWRDIGMKLGFMQDEMNNIEANALLLTGSPTSWLTKMLSDWLQWAPGDGRGSTHFATLEKLKDALKQANLGATADTLHL